MFPTSPTRPRRRVPRPPAVENIALLYGYRPIADTNARRKAEVRLGRRGEGGTQAQGNYH